jgi:hypothetical protein
MTDLKRIIIQTAAPHGDFHGAVAEARYAIDDNEVQLYDMSGISMGPKFRRKLPPHFSASELAAKMLRETVGNRRSNFNRPLGHRHYFNAGKI